MCLGMRRRSIPYDESGQVMSGNDDRRRSKAQRQARTASRRKPGAIGQHIAAPSTGSPKPQCETVLRDGLAANRNDADAVDNMPDGGEASNLELVPGAERKRVTLTVSEEKDRRDRLAKRAERFFERARGQASAVQNAAFAWLLALLVVWAGGIQPSGRRYLAKTQQQESVRLELEKKRESVRLELEEKRKALRKISEKGNPSHSVAIAVPLAQASEEGVDESGVPRSKAGLDAYSRWKELKGDLVDLHKELDELQVGFKVPGVDLNIPLVVAPLVWILLMLGLIYTLAKARQRILSLTAQGARILLEDLSTPQPEISDIVGDFPFWLAPLPIHRAPTATKALALRSALGWENKSLTNGRESPCFSSDPAAVADPGVLAQRQRRKGHHREDGNPGANEGRGRAFDYPIEARRKKTFDGDNRRPGAFARAKAHRSRPGRLSMATGQSTSTTGIGHRDDRRSCPDRLGHSELVASKHRTRPIFERAN